MFRLFMKKPSDEQPQAGGYGIGELLGFGSQSVRKNYYPALQDRIEELEQERNRYKWLFENALHGVFQGDLRAGFWCVTRLWQKSAATIARRILSNELSGCENSCFAVPVSLTTCAKSCLIMAASVPERLG